MKKTVGALLLGIAVGFVAGWYANPQQTDEGMVEADVHVFLLSVPTPMVDTFDLAAEQAEGDLDCPPPEEVLPGDRGVCGQGSSLPQNAQIVGRLIDPEIH